MPIPESETKAWIMIFGEEFVSTPSPYYGINFYDVPAENWEKFKANLREQYEYVKLLSGRSHMWAVRDHGSFKRVIWINYYPEGAKPTRSGKQLEEQGEKGNAVFTKGCQLISSYRWFLGSEVDSGPDAL